MTATTSSSSAVLVPAGPVFSEPEHSETERRALTGFLAGYSSLTREVYALDLAPVRGLALFAARRADIELFGRDLEAAGRARATVTRRLCTVAGLYKYAVEEDFLGIRRPCTSAVRSWTTSRTRPGWTATRSVRCWLPPGWARWPSTR